MANLVLKGLVLRAADYQESSKILTVLTDTRGKITVSAKGALRRSSRIAAASQPFAYAEMSLSESRDRYYLNEAGTISLFPGILADVNAYALGAYFLELLDAACPEGEESASGELALGLNALWLLSEGKKSPALVKAAFEIRLMSQLGYRPETECCPVCGRETPESPMLDLRGGSVYCRSCAEGNALLPMPLLPASLEALRYILSAPDSRVFSFSLGEEAERKLNSAAERYVQEQLERRFSTLDYYKKIKT